MPENSDSKATRSLVGQLLIMTVAMFGFGFLLVPLYDVFCAITGFAGRTNSTAAVAIEAPDLTREVRIEFVTTVNSYAQFEFSADRPGTPAAGSSKSNSATLVAP